MLTQFEKETKTPEIICDKWKKENQDFLKVKDNNGEQGGYKSYDEYVYTVNALHAMDHSDVDMFSYWFEKTGKHHSDTVVVNYSGLPRNPYASMQPRDGAQLITFLDLAKDYEKGKEPKCTNVLIEKFAPPEGVEIVVHKDAVTRPGFSF